MKAPPGPVRVPGKKARSSGGQSRRKALRRFSGEIVDAIRAGKILGIRAGARRHRVIGIWAVVVEGRVFVRSWGVRAGGWYRTFLEEPRGIVQVEGRELPVRAVRTRSERLKEAVERAYREKYTRGWERKYVRGFARDDRRATTTELVPR